jgi:hypothetical protein
MKTLSDYIDQYGLSGWKTSVGGAAAPLVMMLRDEIANPGSTSLSSLDRGSLQIAFKILHNDTNDEASLGNNNLPFFSLRIDASQVPQVESTTDNTLFMQRMDAAFKQYASIVFVHGEPDNPFTQHTDYIGNAGTVTKDALVGTNMITLMSYYTGTVNMATAGWDIFSKSGVITSPAILQNLLELALQNGLDTPQHVKDVFGSYQYAPGVADAAIQHEAKLPVVQQLSDPNSDALIKGYLAYFGRPADPDGLAFWVDALHRAGGDTTSMINNFGNSAEYQAMYGGHTSAEVVNSIYQHLFNRDAEPDGLAFWAGHLDKGDLTVANVAFTIINSAQLSDATIINEKVAGSRLLTQSLDTQHEIDTFNSPMSATNTRLWLSQFSADNTANTKLTGALNDVINHLNEDVTPILVGQGFNPIHH